MAFGFARVSRDVLPEAVASDGDAATAPPPLAEAEGAAPLTFEHVHGDTCCCGLRGE